MPQTQGQFTVFTREEFGNYLENTKFNRQITRIQNHHTYIPNYTHFLKDNPPKPFKWLNSMKASHLARKFSDIAQNLTTFSDGTIALCRPIDVTPSAIKGANTGSVAIEHLGYFDIDQDIMTDEHKETIVYLNAVLCKRFKLAINDQTILYHHWFDLNTGKRTNGSGSTKSCPGTNFFGGNTVEAANANFIPLVVQKHSDLVTGASQPPQPIATGTVIANKLNVRAGAGTNFGILFSLGKGAKINAYAELDGWYKIDPKQSQWVAKQFIAQ